MRISKSVISTYRGRAGRPRSQEGSYLATAAVAAISDSRTTETIVSICSSVVTYGGAIMMTSPRLRTMTPRCLPSRTTRPPIFSAGSNGWQMKAAWESDAMYVLSKAMTAPDAVVQAVDDAATVGYWPQHH